MEEARRNLANKAPQGSAFLDALLVKMRVVAAQPGDDALQAVLPLPEKGSPGASGGSTSGLRGAGDRRPDSFRSTLRQNRARCDHPLSALDGGGAAVTGEVPEWGVPSAWVNISQCMGSASV